MLVDGANGIIAGHGRLLAARKLGLSQVPVIELGHLSETQKRAYVLADNKLSERAGWDAEMLALEVGDLQSLGIDVLDLGFTGKELDDLLRGDTVDPREDEVPPLPEVPVSPRRSARRQSGGKPGGVGPCHPCPNHLGQGAAGSVARALPRAA